MRELMTGGVIPMMTHLMDDARETIQLRDKRIAEIEERNAELEAALTEIRDLLPIEQDNYSRRVFAVAAEALEPDRK